MRQRGAAQLTRASRCNLGHTTAIRSEGNISKAIAGISVLANQDTFKTFHQVSSTGLATADLRERPLR